LVFLHEGLGSVSLWHDFPRLLANATGCGALVYSRFGYGGSSPCPMPRPISFMHDEARQTLPAVLDAAGAEDFLLVGHSDGGSIALIYAGGNPAPGLRGVVTLAAHVTCEPVCREAIGAAKQRFIFGDLRPRLHRHHGQNTDRAFWGWNDAWLHPYFVNWDIRQYLSRITVPVLAIQGRKDPYGTPAQAEIIGRRTTDAQHLLLPHCGHSPHRDHPKAVLERLHKFVMANTAR
jgi:pimeloyl-ACP methyl ester carboxylesterase